MGNQEAKQASVRGITGTQLDYNSDWSALFDLASIGPFGWNGRLLAWINQQLAASYNDLNAAKAAYARAKGVADWDSLGQITPAGVAIRGPKALDDTNAGFAVGDYWYDRSTQTVYRAASVGAGTASWTAQSPINDQIAGLLGAVGAYGVRVLHGFWFASPLFQVKRVSDGATKDIFVGPDGVSADFAAADAFAGSSKIYVSIWYDQSGNGDHLTVAPIGPYVLPGNAVNGHRTLTSGTDANSMQSTVQVALDRQAFSVASIGYTATPCRFTGVIDFDLFNNGNSNLVRAAALPFSKYQAITEGPTLNYDNEVAIPSCRVLRGNASQSDLNVNGKMVTAAAFPAGTVNSMTMNNAFGASQPKEHFCFLKFNRYLSDADVDAIMRWAFVHLDIVPQVRDVVLVVGDSISGGATTNDNPWSRYMQFNLLNPRLIHNIALDGQTAAYYLANTASWLTTAYLPAGRKNVVAILLGTNDIQASDDAPTIYARLTSLVSAAKAVSSSKVVLGTLLPATGIPMGGAAFETVRLALNTLIRGNAAGADGIVDIGAHPVMGQFSNAGNTAYFTDGIHPTDLGQSLIAPLWSTAISKLG